MHKTKHMIALSCCLALAALTGCSKLQTAGSPAPRVREETGLPHRVAILPFVNQTSNPEAALIMRKMFYNFFSSLNYLDVEPTLIDENLKKSHLYQRIITGEQVSPQMLGQVLGVDAVVFGEALSLGKLFAVVYTESRAGLKAHMVSCRSGKTLWELEHTVHLRQGDLPLSLPGLAVTIVKSIVSLQQATHMQATSQLCMEMIATIPNPATVTEPPPRIQVMVHNGSETLLRPGDSLKVVLIGDKGLSASWSLPPLIDNIPMAEEEPGIYLGEYRIKPIDRLPYGRLLGHLRSETGMESQWVDILGPVTIGEPTALAEIISQNTILDKEKSPYLVNQASLVQSEATLTMKPGTVIWFRNSGLIVNGKLNILGTADQPVQVAGMGSVAWKGIFLDRSRKENVLSHCKISGAEFGLRSSQSAFSIRNCIFQDNLWGVVLDGGVGEISMTLLRTSKKSAVAARNAQLTITGSVISENASGGFLLEDCRAQIEKNNISNNGGWAIKALGDHVDVRAEANWWGAEKPDPAAIIGAVSIDPALEQPIKLDIIE